MIVVNNAFVYLHHPKTGGTFVTEMLRKIASDTEGFSIQEIPGLKHAGIKKIPEEYRKLPVVINVRNVFEHYVSRFTFRWWADPEYSKKIFNLEKVKKNFPSFPELTFPEFLRLFNQWSLRRSISNRKVKMLAMYNVGYNSWVLARLATNKPMEIFKEYENLDKDVLNELFLKIRFLRTENLNTDLYGLLRDYGVKEEKISPILKAPPILPKKGGRGKKENTWDTYFTQDEIDLVKQKDRLYFGLFPDMLPE
jgi:hypothetical protein